MIDLVKAIISALLFPGLLFITALALFTQYLVRKLSARYQRRMGPSYVGPFGLLQTFYDFWKLLRVKEVVITKYSMVRASELLLLIGLSSAVASLVFLPLSPLNIRSEFDVLVFFYLASVMPLAMLIMASLAMPGPYTSLGVSRLLSMATISEPAFFASILVPVYLATRSGPRLFMSIAESSAMVPELWSNPVTAVIMALCFVAYIVSLQARALYQPFNIPEAEQEIIAGFETEFSGPLLALARLLHDVDLSISLLLGVYVFLGGPLPFRHLSPLGVVMLTVKYLVLVAIVAYIKNVMGRYRIEQGLVQAFKYSLVPAALAVVLAMLLP